QVHDGGGGGGYVSQRRGVEHLLGASHLTASRDTEACELYPGTAAGVVLDRQGHDLKEHRQAEQHDAELDEPKDAEHGARDDDPGRELRADVGGGHQCAAEAQWAVCLSVLDGVSYLVSSYGVGSDACAAEVGGRQAQHPLGGVVVVG